MSRLRVLSSLVALLLQSALLTATAAAPAQAELVAPSSPDWGLAELLPSSSMNRWDSLGFATEYSDGLVIVGGRFGQLTNGPQTIDQPYLAAFDATTRNAVPWWRPSLNGTVLALEASNDGAMFVGGDFDTYNGASIGAFQKIDPTTGDAFPGWTTRIYGGSSTIRDIRLESDGWLYVVGNFTTATEGNGPRAVNGAVRMDPVTGAIDWSWLPQPDGGSIWGIARSQTTSEVYLAGWFTSMGGDPEAKGFAGVSSTDARVLHTRATIPHNTIVGNTNYHRLYDVIATDEGDVWVGGEQHSLFILDESQNLSLTKMHYTGCNVDYQPDCSRAGGEFQEIERIGDRVYATCHCWGSHHTSTNVILHGGPRPNGGPYEFTGRVSGIAAYDINSHDRIEAFNPYMSGDAGGFGIVGTPDGCVWVTGGFNSFGEPGFQRSARDLVRLCDEAGPGPLGEVAPAPPAPTTCRVTLSADRATATVTFDVPNDATNVVVHRELNDSGTFSWRGIVSAPGTSFSETVPTDTVIRYQVKAKYPNATFSDSFTCTPPVNRGGPGGDPVSPPASCTANAADLNATITWAPVAGASDYRVYRSVDGGTTSWRGKAQTTTFTDTLRRGLTHHYSVQARVDGTWSTSTSCTPDLVGGADGDPVSPPESCTANAADLNATITWAPVAGASDYRVYRSVDGGTTSWRGKAQTTTFTDTLRRGLTHHYSVQARVDGTWSTSTSCSPDLIG